MADRCRSFPALRASAASRERLRTAPERRFGARSAQLSILFSSQHEQISRRCRPRSLLSIPRYVQRPCCCVARFRPRMLSATERIDESTTASSAPLLTNGPAEHDLQEPGLYRPQGVCFQLWRALLVLSLSLCVLTKAVGMAHGRVRIDLEAAGPLADYSSSAVPSKEILSRRSWRSPSAPIFSCERNLCSPFIDRRCFNAGIKFGLSFALVEWG